MRQDESVSVDMVAYAELELAMAYAEQNRYDEARAIINMIYDLPEQTAVHSVHPDE
jgi:predicted negative regulator of RcsB-dependent stress response